MKNNFRGSRTKGRLADTCYGTVLSKCFYAKKRNNKMHLGRSRKLYMTTRSESYYLKRTGSVTLINTSPLNWSCSMYLYALCRILLIGPAVCICMLCAGSSKSVIMLRQHSGGRLIPDFFL